jgi:hypothetical protein
MKASRRVTAASRKMDLRLPKHDLSTTYVTASIDHSELVGKDLEGGVFHYLRQEHYKSYILSLYIYI